MKQSKAKAKYKAPKEYHVSNSSSKQERIFQSSEFRKTLDDISSAYRQAIRKKR